jgi:uncharacterized protein (TIGR02246 family)
MKQRRLAGWKQLVAIASLLAGGTLSVAQAQTLAKTSEERAAVALVKQWFAAWQTGDPDQIASPSMVSDDIQFQGIPSEPHEKGRDALRQHVARLGGAKSITVTDAVAMSGSSGGVVLLTKRLLTLAIGGKSITTPIAALIWVKDGRIQEWEDFPLAALARGPRGAGAAGAESGAPPPGN